MEDAEIVQRVRAGDREAFRVLVQRYQDVLYRTALRHTKQPDVASDLVQSTLVKAYTGIWRCRDPERFGAWVYRIVVNAAKDYLKSRRRNDVSLDEPLATRLHSPAAGNPEREMERAELRDRLERALSYLPEVLREAFLLKHVEGFSYEEIAERLNVSVPALKMRVHRARSTLKDQMDRSGG
ncbi:MAG: RNA polymerase sigma factor [Longimicrobiales bacterium]